ncbi:MAG TPA: pyridoxamine 5'-phosphate oxidase family protein [Longimicrobiales bacterium]
MRTAVRQANTAPESIVTPAVLDGHRRILAVLREFRGTEPWRSGGGADGDAIRALIAFLRHEILPFASREEAGMPPGSEEREATAFEHAFLAAEIDALDRAAEHVRRGAVHGVDDPGQWSEEARRRIDRIEAVLELHTGRQQERWTDAPAEPALPTAEPAGLPDRRRRRGTRSLGGAEAAEVLRRNSWGVLSTSCEGRPYAVPVAYDFDGERFFIASREGREVWNLEANPEVCFTVLEVEDDGACWRSVVVAGVVEWVSGPRESLAALSALGRRRNRAAPTSFRAAARPEGARVVRIIPREITGRASEG